MEFDKSKVYTALNADELKVGSKVIVADCLDTLRRCVLIEDDIVTIETIRDERHIARFFNGTASWNLAYLVEEPEEKKLKWTDLKVGDIIRNNKEQITAMVTRIDEGEKVEHYHILAGNWIANDDIEDWEKVEE